MKKFLYRLLFTTETTRILSRTIARMDEILEEHENEKAAAPFLLIA